MKYAPGDKIALKSDQREGRIIGYIDPHTAEVMLKDGETVNVTEDDLEYPYLNMFRRESRKNTDKKIKKYHTQKEEFKQERIPKGLLLGFWPVYFSEDFDDLVDDIKIHFYNDTNDEVEFYYNYSDDHSKGIELRKTLKAYEDVYIHTIAFESLNDHPKFSLQLAPKGEELEDISLKLKPKKIFDGIASLSEKHLPTYYHTIAKDIYEVYLPEKKDDLNTSPSIFNVPRSDESLAEPPPQSDDFIDLHIHALFPEDWQGIPKNEILKLQVNIFHDFFSEAIQNKIKKITILHGIGTGKLRAAVHEILENSIFVEKYENELHPQFGYGATIVWLR